jgi:virulence factor Mce-like protein
MALFKEFQPGLHAPRHMRNGLILLAVVGAALFYAYSGGKVPFAPKGGYTVKARFATAANVTPGKTPVRVDGVEVGEVEKVERAPGNRGVVLTMRINKEEDGFKLQRDARADIYWRTLLGFAFYVELTPGTDPRPLGGETIPESRTTAQTELDQVLASATPPARAGMQRFFKEFDKGFNGNQAAGRTLDVLGPSFRQIGPGVGALRGKSDGDLTSLVQQTSRWTGALARREVELGNLINNAETTLGVTAARKADISSMLQNAPSTLDQTRSTMSRLRTTLDVLDPVAEDLRPGARKLDDASLAMRPALKQLQPVLADARPLLRDLRPALRSLRSASRSGTPLMSQMEPVLQRLNSGVLPGLNEVNPETGLKEYEAVGPTIASVSNSASLFDKNGTTQRFQAVNGGANTLALLPCNVGQDLTKLKLDCTDVKAVFGAFFGLPTGGSKSKLLAKLPSSLGGTGSAGSSSSTSSRASSSAGSSGSDKRPHPASKKVASGVKQLATTLEGLL